MTAGDVLELIAQDLLERAKTIAVELAIARRQAQ
jgi:hypothetical protein